jgi:hypothetical protein
MCLIQVTKRYPANETVGYGYKVIEPLPYMQPPEFKTPYLMMGLRPGRWIRRILGSENQRTIVSGDVLGDPLRYPNGFHVFRSLEAAKALAYVYGDYRTRSTAVIARVEYRSVFVKGTDETYKEHAGSCLVVRYIRLSLNISDYMNAEGKPLAAERKQEVKEILDSVRKSTVKVKAQ